MSLSQIVDAIGARLETDGVTATIQFGGEFLFQLSAPPRIVFKPVDGTGGPVDKGGLNPRPLRTRNVRVEAHCWGDTSESAEALLSSLIAATHAVAGGSYDFTSERWPDLNSELLANGRVVVGMFVFRVPVTAPAQQTATITSTNQTEQFE